MTALDNETRESARAATDAPTEGWYAALASSRLTHAPAAVRVLDQSLVLFRDQDGRPHAVRDRCIHRGARLRLGEVTEGALACRYHGWRFAGDGRCVHIPSLTAGEAIPEGSGVRAFPCLESEGYVWAWMGDQLPGLALEPIEAFDQFDWVQGALELKCTALLAIENNLDWCHPVFAHPKTHGMYFINQAMGFQEQTIEVRLSGRGICVFAPPTADADAPPDPTVSLTFALPDRVTVAFSLGSQGPARIVMHLVPTGAATCRQEWLASTGPADPARGPRIVWTDETNPIFEQDRQLLESIQEARTREGRGSEWSVEADVPTLLARRVYGLACAGRWEQERRDLVHRRLIRVRT